MDESRQNSFNKKKKDYLQNATLVYHQYNLSVFLSG